MPGGCLIVEGVEVIPADSVFASIRTRPAVVVFVDDDGRWTRPSRRVGTSEVAADGRFDVRGLPAGDRYLAVAVDGASRSALAQPEMLAALRGLATPLRIDEGGTHELALTAVPRPLK